MTEEEEAIAIKKEGREMLVAFFVAMAICGLALIIISVL